MVIGSESETVEFKISTGEKKEAMEAVGAILNKHCRGTVYFGVDDSGFVKGQQISDSTKKDISRIINESIEPRIVPTIEVLTMNLHPHAVLSRVLWRWYQKPFGL